MDDKIFKKYIFLIESWLTEDIQNFNVVQRLDRDIIFNFQMEFYKELSVNFDNLIHTEEKRLLLKIKLLRLKDLQAVFNQYNWRFRELEYLSTYFATTSDEYFYERILEEWVDRGLWEEILVAAYYYYIIILVFIEMFCEKIETNIFILSEELNMSSSLFKNLYFLDLEKLGLRKSLPNMNYTSQTNKIDRQEKDISSIESGSEKYLPFSEYLRHEKQIEFAEALKLEFKNQIGVQIRIMIEGLKRNDLLIIPRRKFKKFFLSLKDYFDWYIGSYQSINDANIIKCENEISEVEKIISKIRDKIELPVQI